LTSSTLPLPHNGKDYAAASKADEKTEVIHGAENIVNITLQNFPALDKRIDNCIDSSAPVSLVKTEPVWKSLIELKQRGVILRYITEITKENISYCNEMMKVVELRHLDRIKGNFATISTSTGGPLT
jgi:hypothetical protein